MATLRASATPQQEKYKTCSKCRRSKPVSMFYLKKKGGNVLRSECKRCWLQKTPKQKARIKKYLKKRSARPEIKAISTARTRAANGFHAGMFETALALQQNRCAICRHLFTKSELTPQSRRSSPQLACADHDHATKKPRGVLCSRCNKGIGHLDDSITLLEAAIEYLRNPPLDLV